MKNIEKLLYTYKHRKIVLMLAKKYYNNKELLDQLEKHDLDKMFLLLLFDKSLLKGIHRSISNHHDNDLPKTELDYVEMILDWESARYTKEDKPLNAYDTLIKYYPHLEDKLLPILKEMKLDKSNTDKEQDIVEYAKTLEHASEDDVKDELIQYIKKL